MYRIFPLLLWIALCFSSAASADYYLDALQGKDTNSGLTADDAWQSLAQLNTQKFKPGDRIFLKRGQTYEGQFRPLSSGKKGAVIAMTGYGSGPKPVIAAGGRHEAAIVLDNLSYWWIQDLEITNTGATRFPMRKGVHLIASRGIVKSITLKGLFIHDINGVFSKEAGGGAGIQWEADSRRKKSKFDGLLIEDCHLARCDRDAIKGNKKPWSPLDFLSTNVVIRGNLIEDVGGDGIVALGTEGALVEYNRIYGGRLRFDTSDQEMVKQAGASVGIWPWSSVDTHFRFNEVWGYEGVYDGQGLDADYNCRGTLFEYNFTSNNAGGFFLICSNGKHQDSGASIGNQAPVIRHNISFNDRLRVFVINGGVEDVLVEENIIYNTIEEKLPLLINCPWGKAVKSVSVKGNLFYTKGEATMYSARWGKEVVGTWTPSGELDRKAFTLSNNAYSNIREHTEPGMQMLSKEETLSSLVGRLCQDKETTRNFKTLIDFLKQSRNWDKIEPAI